MFGSFVVVQFPSMPRRHADKHTPKLARNSRHSLVSSQCGQECIFNADGGAHICEAESGQPSAVLTAVSEPSLQVAKQSLDSRWPSRPPSPNQARRSCQGSRIFSVRAWVCNSDIANLSAKHRKTLGRRRRARQFLGRRHAMGRFW